jgi:hypothetical protein
MSHVKSRLGSSIVMAAGAAYAASGVVQIVHRQNTGEDVVGVSGHLMLGLFAFALIASAVGYLALGDRARTTKAAKVVALGTLALGIASLTSVINSHDLVFFKVVAPITNAMWLFGSIALAVSLKRAGRVPRAVYIGLPLVWVAAIPLSMVGGGILAGAYWLTVGYLLSESSLETRQPKASAVTA